MKKRTLLFELLLILIITIPSFLSLLNKFYFSMHDDQHIARLYLLDQGIKQGYLYPRWVDMLGFNHGYPLFNFYPPLVYYVAEILHLLGFSFIWSIKLTFILGFFIAAIGVYFLVKKIAGQTAALLSSVLYTYFFYHAVLIYVRGALAEFFALAIIPFVFLSLQKNSLWFGISFAFLILAHPLIAFPMLFFLGFYLIFFLIFSKKNKVQFLKRLIIGGLLAISLSAFFWIPSIVERKFTLIDNILTRELANYKIHFIYLQQFLYSPWGYGGSIAGPFDGMTFQLGKIPIFLVVAAFVLSFVYFKKKKFSNDLLYFYFFLLLLLFSLFMTTQFSSFIWDNIKYLWYLQFPWRFLAFAGFFIAVCGSYAVFFLQKFVKRNSIIVITVIIFITAIVGSYQRYFRPQRYLLADDKRLTSFEEIAWRVSRTSHEFVPKGAKITKSELGTTILDIKKEQISKSPYDVVYGEAGIIQIKNQFADKYYVLNAKTQTRFRLNTFNFPGWSAYLDNKKISIDDSNQYKLITVDIPEGSHKLTFVFEDTPIRKFANALSILTLVFVLFYSGRVVFMPKFK